MSRQPPHRKSTRPKTFHQRLRSVVINTDSSWLKFRFLKFGFCKEETLNYLCCQFDGEGFHSFKVMAGRSWQEGVQCRLVIDLTSQGHSRSKKTVPNETSYVTSYMSIMVGLTNGNPILHNFRDISQNSVIMGVNKQIWPPCRHFLNRTENKWAYMLAIPSVLSAPSLKEIQLVLFELRLQGCLHPRWPPCRHFEWYQKSIWRA